MKLAANLSWLYTEYPFHERIKACAEDGFSHAECMFPYEHDPGLLARIANDMGVRWVLINAPAGDWAAGSRGLASNPGRRSEFRASIGQAIEYAQVMQVKKVHVLAGLADFRDETALKRAWDCYVENLRWLADETAMLDIEWLIEPINRTDIPGYLLAEQATAHALVMHLNRPNLGVQMDLYHCQRQEGNALNALSAYLPTGRVRHLQIAGVPNRNEPGHAEAGGDVLEDAGQSLDYGRVCQQLKQLGYEGTIGCEYRPKTTTRDGLGWIRSTGFSGTMEGF